MFFLPDDKMFPNRFIETKLPTKGQIFSRTGRCAVSPNGVFTQENPALIGSSPTEKAERFVRDAESYVRAEPVKSAEPDGKE